MIFIAKQRICAQIDQHAHERRVVGCGGQKEWRRPDPTELASARRPGLEPRVHLRSVLYQLSYKLETTELSGANRSWVSVFAVAVVWFPDPGNRVERCETGALVIGISAHLQQRYRQFKMAVLDRQEQGTHPLPGPFTETLSGLYGFVYVYSSLQ